MKKFLIVLILTISIQFSALADDLQILQQGSKTIFKLKGIIYKTIETYQLDNGLVEIQVCLPQISPWCSSEIMKPLEARNAIDAIIIGEREVYKFARKQAITEQQNKKKIVKQVSITTNKGKKITLIEDGNGVDFLIINGKRIKKFAERIATYKEEHVYRPDPDNYKFENVIANEIQQDRISGKKRTYNEIVLSSAYFNTLFKLVYRLRIEQGVSYEDAKKLMTFGIDNGDYKPEDLLLPKERLSLQYNKDKQQAKEKLKDIKFPTI